MSLNVSALGYSEAMWRRELVRNDLTVLSHADIHKLSPSNQRKLFQAVVKISNEVLAPKNPKTASELHTDLQSLKRFFVKNEIPDRERDYQRGKTTKVIRSLDDDDYQEPVKKELEAINDIIRKADQIRSGIPDFQFKLDPQLGAGSGSGAESAASKIPDGFFRCYFKNSDKRMDIPQDTILALLPVGKGFAESNERTIRFDDSYEVWELYLDPKNGKNSLAVLCEGIHFGEKYHNSKFKIDCQKNLLLELKEIRKNRLFSSVDELVKTLHFIYTTPLTLELKAEFDLFFLLCTLLMLGLSRKKSGEQFKQLRNIVKPFLTALRIYRPDKFEMPLNFIKSCRSSLNNQNYAAFWLDCVYYCSSFCTSLNLLAMPVFTAPVMAKPKPSLTDLVFSVHSANPKDSYEAIRVIGESSPNIRKVRVCLASEEGNQAVSHMLNTLPQIREVTLVTQDQLPYDNAYFARISQLTLDLKNQDRSRSLAGFELLMGDKLFARFLKSMTSMSGNPNFESFTLKNVKLVSITDLIYLIKVLPPSVKEIVIENVTFHKPMIKSTGDDFVSAFTNKNKLRRLVITSNNIPLAPRHYAFFREKGIYSFQEPLVHNDVVEEDVL